MKQKEIVSKIVQALVHEYTQSISGNGQVAIHNTACELDKHFPGVLHEFDVMLLLVAGQRHV